MDAPSPARLYANLLGAALLVFGLVGFSYSASFGSPGAVDEVFGAFPTNAWLNLVYVVTGAVGLVIPGSAARAYALAVGAIYTALAIWGFALPGEEAIAGLLPSGAGDETLHLALGLLGLLAARLTPTPAPTPRTPSSPSRRAST